MKRVKFTVLCTAFMMAVAASSIYAGASCCDPANNSGQSFLSVPSQQTAKPMGSQVQVQSNAARPQPAVVTSMGSGWNVPQNKGYAAPSRSVNAPQAPSCCSGPNNQASQQIQPPPAAGCGCCGGGAGYRGNQPGLTQGPARQAAGPYAQPAANGYGNQQFPVAVGPAARPANSGPLW
ncbi:MAG: hypothetical protein HY912_23825 [Desulfomonile tiedjei]|uniref:Secreted protein n=1 Tax=Desulfomonile tiedjei TaxID=2358 RepID=A0A9D6V8H6_9BACT|nr:hypothetical protein [Desulfomonile tiedjei]